MPAQRACRGRDTRCRRPVHQCLRASPSHSVSFDSTDKHAGSVSDQQSLAACFLAVVVVVVVNCRWQQCASVWGRNSDSLIPLEAKCEGRPTLCMQRRAWSSGSAPSLTSHQLR